MSSPKPPYPAAFRQQMVELVRAGRGIGDLAREFGCNASSIHAWMEAAGGPDGSGATSIDAPICVFFHDARSVLQAARADRFVAVG